MTNLKRIQKNNKIIFKYNFKIYKKKINYLKINKTIKNWKKINPKLLYKIQ
jgi:hypothetical protein